MFLGVPGVRFLTIDWHTQHSLISDRQEGLDVAIDNELPRNAHNLLPAPAPQLHNPKQCKLWLGRQTLLVTAASAEYYLYRQAMADLANARQVAADYFDSIPHKRCALSSGLRKL